MESILIREASFNDLDLLFEFEEGIIEAERQFEQKIKKGKVNYYDLKEMLNNPLTYLVVAEENKQIIATGYARIEKAKPYLTYENYAYLGFMFVLPEFRGKGINAMILEKLKSWVITKNIKEMKLEVYADNITAIKAYEKFGFKKHMVEMTMSI